MVLLSVYLYSFAFSVLSFAWISVAENCKTLEGKWYNQLGSEIFLKHENDGKLLGEYRTAAEREKGSAGPGHSILLGSAPYEKPGATFAFSVVWRNGSSTTVWTGQCLVCEDGHEKLLTSWLLRSKVNTCIDKWKSTMVGRDTFTRYEQRDGPRKPNVPATETPPNIKTVIKNWDPEGQNKPCNLNGKWYNLLGSEMILKQGEDSVIKGEFRTAVERQRGAAGTSHSKVLGIGQLGGANSTFAFFVVWSNGKSVTGWVGQCHICGENKTEVIESAWLLRSKVDKCSDNWKSTFFDEDTFTHTATKPGPRKDEGTHLPDRSGHNPQACEGCRLWFSITLLSLSVLSSFIKWY